MHTRCFIDCECFHIHSEASLLRNFSHIQYMQCIQALPTRFENKGEKLGGKFDRALTFFGFKNSLHMILVNVVVFTSKRISY